MLRRRMSSKNAGAPADSFGFSLAVGYYGDKTKKRALAIGSPWRGGSGAVYLYRYGTDWKRTNRLTLSNPTGNDEFGWDLRTADINNDGDTDLLVSAPLRDGNGRVSVLKGKSGNVSFDHHWDAVDSTRDFSWGSAIGSGDFNNDGEVDLIIGANTSTTDGKEAGAMYVYQGVVNGYPKSADAERHTEHKHTAR